MSRDYAPRRKRPAGRQAKKSGGVPGWVWLIAGLCIGLSVAAFVYVGRPVGARVALPNVPTQQRAEPEKKKPQLPPKEKPRFSFYELLPSYEVVIPTEPSAQGGGKPPAIAEPGDYMIQVGSFRGQRDAEAQKAKLALLGVESRVEKVTIDNTDTWYRVRIGPVSDPQQVQNIVSQLRDNGIDSLLMRVKS